MWNQYEADLVMQEDIINTRLAKITNELQTERQNAEAAHKNAEAAHKNAEAAHKNAETERKNAETARLRIQEAVKRLYKSGQTVGNLSIAFDLSINEVNAMLKS